MPSHPRSVVAAFLLLLTFAACTQGGNEASLIHFTSEAGRFTVEFPAPSSNQDLMEFNLPKVLLGQEVQCTVLMSRDDAARWTVQFCDVPDAVSKTTDQSALIDWARDEALASASARLDLEEPTAVPDGCTGSTLTGRANMRGDVLDGTFKARTCLLGNRLFIIAAEVYDGAPSTSSRLAMTDPFLDSLSIDMGLTIPYETPTSE